MRTTITVDDELVSELLALMETANRTAAINAAIEAHVRRLKLEGLRTLAGQVDVASNDEIEATDVAEAQRGAAGRRERRGRG